NLGRPADAARAQRDGRWDAAVVPRAAQRDRAPLPWRSGGVGLEPPAALPVGGGDRGPLPSGLAGPGGAGRRRTMSAIIRGGRGTWLVALLLCTLVACKREKGTGPLHLPQADGSVRAVPAEVVQRGLVVYRQHCSACHGDEGRGPPPGGQYLKPAPRAFTQGLFKFGDVAAGQLPRDEALKRTIRRGLHGTPMTGWVLPEDDLEALVQALKTFSPRWREEPEIGRASCREGAE